MDVLPSAHDKGRDLAVWHQVSVYFYSSRSLNQALHQFLRPLCIPALPQALVLPNVIATPIAAAIKNSFDKVTTYPHTHACMICPMIRNYIPYGAGVVWFTLCVWVFGVRCAVFYGLPVRDPCRHIRADDQESEVIDLRFDELFCARKNAASITLE